MQPLSREHWDSLRGWLMPERPCALIGWHTLATGLGRWWVDRWPRPGCALVFVGGNLTLAGDAQAFVPDAFAERIAQLRRDWDHLFLDVPDAFAAGVRAASTDFLHWPRVHYTTERPLPTRIHPEPGAVRRLGSGDAAAVAALDDGIAWIADTLGGPEALAAGGRAFGAFASGRLVSLAVPFYVGERFEELGVVTEADWRGAGWSTRCATAVVADIQSRGRLPCWATTPDNAASRRVAEKLGLVRTAETLHLMVGDPIAGALPAG